MFPMLCCMQRISGTIAVHFPKHNRSIQSLPKLKRIEPYLKLKTNQQKQFPTAFLGFKFHHSRSRASIHFHCVEKMIFIWKFEGSKAPFTTPKDCRDLSPAFSDIRGLLFAQQLGGDFEGWLSCLLVSGILALDQIHSFTVFLGGSIKQGGMLLIPSLGIKVAIL